MAMGKQRRPKGEGSIYQISVPRKDPRTGDVVKVSLWRAQKKISDPKNPNQKVSVYGDGYSQTQAWERLDKNINRRLQSGGSSYSRGSKKSSQNASQSLSEYFYDWFSKDYLSNAGELQRYKYKQNMENHVLPVLGDKHISDIDLNDLQLLFYESLPAKTKPTGEALLSPTTLKNIRANLNVVLNSALNTGVIDRNPITALKLKKSYRPEENIPHFMHVMKGVFKKMKREGDPDFDYFMLTWLGLRQGERLGLTWDDVVLVGDNPKIKINKTLTRIPGKGMQIKDGTKNTGEREIPLYEPYLGSLKMIKKEQRARVKICELVPKEGFEKLVFLNAKGSPVSLAKDNDRWRRMLSKHEVKVNIRGHAMRHISATLLAELQVDEASAKRILGHESTSMAHYYARKTAKGSRQSIEKLAEFLEESFS